MSETKGATMSETAVERRLRGVERMYRSIPGMCPTRHEQDATADAIDAGREAIALLPKVLPYIETLDDEGPYGEGWQSPELEQLIAKIRALLARCEGEK